MTALALPLAKRTLHPYPRDSLRSVAVLGTYVPRRCGIATFTSDLVAALRQEAPESRFEVVALNVTKLRSDNVDPREYLDRLDAWKERIEAEGGTWRVINDLDRLETLL